jgi:small-conductance mechanosensitive channel
MSTQSRTQQQPASPAVASPDVQPGLAGAFRGGGTDVPAQIAAQAASLHELRAELNQLRAERDRLSDRQRQIAELLKSTNPEKIVHDLRNVLNELTLYKALVDVQG